MLRCLPSLVAALGVLAAAPANAQQYFEQVPGSPLGPAADWTNYLALADLDGDADLDLLIPNCGGFFSSPQAQPFRLYRLDDGVFTESTTAALGAPLSAAVRVVAVGDIDGDGDLDFVMPAAGGLSDRLYINDGSGAFVDQASTRLPGPGSRSAGARFGDVDGDGDLDLLIAQGYVVSDSPVARLYFNDGKGTFVAAPAQNLPATMLGSDPDDVDFIDIDRDFDLDLLINSHTGRSALWRNNGAGVFTDASTALPAPTGGPFHYNPGACDVDADGDLDLWIDNTASGQTEQLLINDGTGKFADETDARVDNNPSADDNGVWCVDVDADGDFDAVVASLSDNERVLFNDGTGKFEGADDAFPAVSDPTLWMDFGDLDGDGRLDVVTGQGEGNPRVNRVYLGTAEQPVDKVAPKLIAIQPLPKTVHPDDTPALRFAVSDSTVSDLGPRLERAFARIAIGTADPLEIDATFAGGDLFRVALPAQPAGTAVSVQMCATDPHNNEACSPSRRYTVVAGGDIPADDPNGPAADHGGCSASGHAAPWLALVFAAIATTLARRRRR